MKNFGPTYKFLRNSKGLSQEKAAKGIMSRSNLSRFESGDYAPSHQKIIQLTERYAVSFEEMMFIHNDYQLPEVARCYQELVQAENMHDRATIQKIAEASFRYLEAGQLEYELIFYLSQSALQQFPEIEPLIDFHSVKDYVKNYLSQADTWFVREFQLLNNFLCFFETEDLLFLMKQSLKRMAKYDQFLRKSNLPIHLPMNAGIILFHRKVYNQSQRYLTIAKDQALQQNKLYQVLICECYLALIAINGQTATPEDETVLEQNLLMLQRWDYTEIVAEIKKLIKK